jgi:hypothetical protein
MRGLAEVGREWGDSIEVVSSFRVVQLRSVLRYRRIGQVLRVLTMSTEEKVLQVAGLPFWQPAERAVIII